MAVTVEAVLDLLQGWELKESTSDGPDPEVDDGSVHTITTEEVTKFITKAKVRAAAHIELENVAKLPETDLVDEAVATWAAGLLYNKYVIKVTEGKEDQDPTTYGDRKISEAKAILKSVTISPEDDDSQGGSQITVFSINSETLDE
jgi:hypothetical protein